VEGSRIRMVSHQQGRLNGLDSEANPTRQIMYCIQKRNLAVIEAKARDKYYTEGIGQAKDYAEKLQVRFTYSTNGLQIYRIDMEAGQEGEVTSYPTPDELWEMKFGAQNQLQPLSAVWRDKLLSVPFEDRGGTWQPRYYQEMPLPKYWKPLPTTNNAFY
jgi:type I restriction enzyme R subunit